MSLLRDLWGDAGGGGGAGGDGGGNGGNQAEGAIPPRSQKDLTNFKEKGMTFAQVVSSSSSEEGSSLAKNTGMGSGGASSGQSGAAVKLAGSKRARSPTEKTCGRCFRWSHKTSECRHQVVCLRCSGVGHVAARCSVVLRRSPQRKRLHVRSKIMEAKAHTGSGVRPDIVPIKQVDGSNVQIPQRPRRVVLSLVLSLEINVTRDELAKVAVLTVVSGYVNVHSVLEVAPTLINRQLAGPITPLNEDAFLVPLASRDEVKEVCKLGTFSVATKDGPCTLRLAPWTTELGADGRASGEGLWVLVWNLPLHAWSWNVIAEVMRPVGELVALSHASTSHKRFLSVLVR